MINDKFVKGINKFSDFIKEDIAENYFCISKN